MAAGKDDRFDHIKPYLLRFLNVWSIQVNKWGANGGQNGGFVGGKG
jgi:hypothetical protein